MPTMLSCHDNMCVRRGRWRKQVLMSQIRKSEEGVYFFLFQNRLEGRVGQWSDKHHRETEKGGV